VARAGMTQHHPVAMRRARTTTRTRKKVTEPVGRSQDAGAGLAPRGEAVMLGVEGDQ